MKYQERDFTSDLLEKIKNTESALKIHLEQLLREYKPLIAKKNLNFDAEFTIDGKEPFKPGYSSSVSIGLDDESGELIDLHIIKIWECERTLLGMPITKNIPGSRIIGSLIDETIEEVKEELKEYIEVDLKGYIEELLEDES